MTEAYLLNHKDQIMKDLGHERFMTKPVTVLIPKGGVEMELDRSSRYVVFPSDHLPDQVQISSLWGEVGTATPVQTYLHTGQIWIRSQTTTNVNLYFIELIPLM